MAKKLKKLNYVENLVTFISRMISSNWVDDDTLIPFKLNQWITGTKIKVAEDTDIIDNFLENYQLQSPTGDALIAIGDVDNAMMIGVTLTTSEEPMWTYPVLSIQKDEYGMYLYNRIEQTITSPSSETVTMPKGWSYMHFGTVDFTQITEDLIIPTKIAQPIQVVYYDTNIDVLNGVYIGAIESK